MDPSYIETLVQRLVANPYDEEALAYAQQAGASDPRAYAMLLEKIGTSTPDAAHASHWLSEAANVWAVSLGDAHRAARILMIAVDKDPTQDTAAERLAALYREKGDARALLALYERRIKALTPLSAQSPELVARLAQLHEELGRTLQEPPYSQVETALQHYQRAIELEPRSAFAIYAAREIYKAAQQWAEAIQLFDMEHAIVDDAQRKIALYLDESAVRKQAGDLAGASQLLRMARAIDPESPELILELATLVLDRAKAGEQLSAEEKTESAQLFVSLGEMYGGEHGVAYSFAALKLDPGNDRAIQLAAYFGRQMGQTDGLPNAWKAYLAANPNGAMAGEVRQEMAAAGIQQGPAMPPPPPPRPGPGKPSVRGVPAAKPARDSHAALDDLAKSDDRHAPTSRPPAAKGAPPPRDLDYDDEPDSLAAPVAPAASPDKVSKLLAAASEAASRGNKADAFAKYKEVLSLDPANSEAVPWVKDHLRQKRLYPELRELLVNASRGMSGDEKKSVLRELAGLCEQQLRDVEGAIQAFKQLTALDRQDSAASESLKRLLEKSSRWDELASLLEEEAMTAPDVEEKIALEKKLAQLHEGKRKDIVAAGEAWNRIAGLSPNDEHPVMTAVGLFEKADRLDLAAQAISDNVTGIDDEGIKGTLLSRLGDLQLKIGDKAAAGDAYAEAAEFTKSQKTWQQAEKAYVESERWGLAARAVDAQFDLVKTPKEQAAISALAAGYHEKAGDDATAINRIAQAAELDPINDDYFARLEKHYTENDQFLDLAELLTKRAEHVTDKEARVAMRRRVAVIQRDQLDNMDAARATLSKILEDGDDEETLLLLAEDSESREEYNDAISLLKRLSNSGGKLDVRVKARLREARLLAERVDDADAAIACYESVLKDLDPKSREALGAIAQLEEQRENYKVAAETLERELALCDGADKLPIAQHLVDLYSRLEDQKGAAAALEVVVAHGATNAYVDQLIELREQLEDWSRVAELLGKRLEGAEEVAEAGQLARRLASILNEKLQRGDEGLAALESPADAGDERCRDAYVELGDALGRGGLVATKILQWNEGRGVSPQRNAALRGAFKRFAGIERDADAIKVALELIRTKSGDVALAQELETIAVRAKDIDALQTAHDLIAKDLSGFDRAEELIRQAEIMLKAGLDASEALQHGEIGLSSVPAAEVDGLLNRLAALAATPGQAIDLYERQVSRAKAPADRLRALARAARVAAEKNVLERAKSFFDLALAAGVSDDALNALEQAAEEADGEKTEVRYVLANALSLGGQGSRDGGRTRALLLRRAARIAQHVLNDITQAFTWLGDAVVAHVDATSLDALEQLGHDVGEHARVDAILTRALSEVFDGPLVRQLLTRRAALRKNVLSDKQGAAQDLKKLHDLSPADHAVMDELGQLLSELGDFRGMVQLLEDQILRTKDQSVRADIARKVAILWEERLADAREAADAWRRVLRMKPGDADATAGLERAKSNQLRKAPDSPAAEAAPVAAVKPAPAPAPAPAPVEKPKPAISAAPADEPIPDTTTEMPAASIPEAAPTGPTSSPPPESDAPLTPAQTAPAKAAPPMPPRSSRPPPPTSDRPPPSSRSAPPPPPKTSTSTSLADLGGAKPMARPGGLPPIPPPPGSPRVPPPVRAGGPAIPVPPPSGSMQAAKPVAPPKPPPSARPSNPPPLPPRPTGAASSPAPALPASAPAPLLPSQNIVPSTPPPIPGKPKPPAGFNNIEDELTVAAPGTSQALARASMGVEIPKISERGLPGANSIQDEPTKAAPPVNFNSEEEDISSVDDAELIDAAEAEDIDDDDDEKTPPKGVQR